MPGRAGQRRRQRSRRAILAGEREARRRDGPWRGGATTSRIACASARSLLRNFSRAGVAKNRSRTSMRVPRAERRRAGPRALSPASTTIAPGRAPAPARAWRSRAARPSRSTAAPRRGSRACGSSSRSSSGSFEVAWRSTASARSSARHAGAVVDDADEPPAAAVGQRPRCGARRRRARSRPVPSRPPPAARSPRRRRCG